MTAVAPIITIRQTAARGWLTDALPATLYAALLLFPIWQIIATHGTLTGISEESVGFRYFYTLRSIYDGRDFFLPQGELPNLIFKAIHLALSALGYPPTQLFPRIDYFTYASIVGMHLISVVCFWWATIPLRSAPARLSAASFWGLLYYIPKTSAVYTVVQPDYMLLFPALSLMTVGFILRTRPDYGWTAGRVFAIGLFVGAAASVKITLVVLPAIALMHAMLMSRQIVSSLVAASLVSAIGMFFWVTAFTLDSNTNVIEHFSSLLSFMGGGQGAPDAGLSWTSWITQRLSEQPSPVLTTIYAGPLLALLAAAIATRRWERCAAWSFFVGLCAYHVFLFKRDYAITILECYFPLAALFTVCSQFSIFNRLTAIRWGLAPVCLVTAVWFYPEGIGNTLSYVTMNTRQQQVFNQVKTTIKGRLLWLIEDNTHRPLSVDSAIMKGGVDMSARWLNPPSAIMKTMFPNLDYRLYGNDVKPDFSNYDAVMFPFSGSPQKRQGELASVYGQGLAEWSCQRIATVAPQEIALCRKQ